MLPHTSSPTTHRKPFTSTNPSSQSSNYPSNPPQVSPTTIDENSPKTFSKPEAFETPSIRRSASTFLTIYKTRYFLKGPSRSSAASALPPRQWFKDALYPQLPVHMIASGYMAELDWDGEVGFYIVQTWTSHTLASFEVHVEGLCIGVYGLKGEKVDGMSEKDNHTVGNGRRDRRKRIIG